MSGNNIEVGHGVAEGADSFVAGLDAARQAVASIKEHSASVVLVFASVRYDLEEALRGIRHVIRGAPILGTTTAGEICNATREGSIVVLVLASPYLKVAIGVGEKVSLSWEDAVMQAVGIPELMPYFASDASTVHKRLTLEGKQVFALLFSPGNTSDSDSCSFEILEKLKQLSENRLPIFGGSSADDWHMDTNFVLHDGKAYRDSLLLAVFETSLQFGMAFYHGFTPGSDQTTITKAEGHEIRELNGRPAAEVFAGLLGKPVKALERKHLTFTSGRLIGVPDPYGQYSIKVASYVTPGGGIRLSQPIARGVTLSLMQSEPDSLVSAGKEAFLKALLRGNVENAAVAIVFSCAVRQKLLVERIGEEISNIMQIAPGVPVTGFYSFGEQGLADDGSNRHNNGVITALVIGKDLSYAARVASENNVLRQQLELVILNLKKQKKIVREAEKKYRTIFENAREGIYQSTHEGRYLSVNPVMAKMYGYASPEEMITAIESIDQQTFVIQEEWEELKRLLAAQGETDDFEVEQRRRDGSTFWASMRVHAVYGEDGRSLYWEGRCIDITERKRAEDSVRQQSQFLEVLLETIPNPVFYKDVDGRYTGCNRAFENLFERSRQEIIGNTVYDMGPKEIAEKYAQKDRELFDHPGEQYYEWRVQRKNGEIREVIFHKATIFDNEGHLRGIIGVVSDITDRKHAEEELSQQHSQLEDTVRELERARSMLQLIIESIPVRVFWKDRDFRYLGCNTLFARDTGLSSPEQLLGQDDFTMGWKKQAELYQADDREVMESGIPKMNLIEPQTTPAGTTIWLNTSKTPLRKPDGEVFGVLGVYEDITERKRAEEEHGRLEERLRRAEKMEALGTLAGGVAHDLNNVLGIVVGYSELLLDDLNESGSKRTKALEILRGGQRAAAIVQDLLTLARRGVSSKKVLNLNRIIMECSKSPEFASVLSFHPDIEVKMDFEPDLLKVMGSAIHLEKSFINLVLNAAEAMPDGGILLVKTASRYLDKPISGYDEVREGDYVVLSVSDTGEGIAAHDLRRIFEPFYTKKIMGRSGTGLGLAVVWGTVKDHFGYINVESEEGKGTTFTLYFPVTREDVTPKQASISASEYMGNGESILIVDDVKEQRELASTMLKKLKYTVESVSSGEEAVEYLKKNAADLVVLDMIMDPGMDGLNTYVKILEIHPRQKAIIVSGFSETERVGKAQALGAGAYVKKPYVLEKLGLAVRKELGQQTIKVAD